MLGTAHCVSEEQKHDEYYYVKSYVHVTKVHDSAECCCIPAVFPCPINLFKVTSLSVNLKKQPVIDEIYQDRSLCKYAADNSYA